MAMDAIGCSYAENILVNLNKKKTNKLKFLKCVHVSFCSFSTVNLISIKKIKQIKSYIAMTGFYNYLL